MPSYNVKKPTRRYIVRAPRRSYGKRSYRRSRKVYRRPTKRVIYVKRYVRRRR